MKSLKLKEMGKVNGGSSESTLCFFSIPLWFAAEANGSMHPAGAAMARGLISYCWNS